MDIKANRLAAIAAELAQVDDRIAALTPERYALQKGFRPDKHALPAVDTQQLRELLEKKATLEEERLKNPDVRWAPRGHKTGFELSAHAPQWRNAHDGKKE